MPLTCVATYYKCNRPLDKSEKSINLKWFPDKQLIYCQIIGSTSNCCTNFCWFCVQWPHYDQYFNKVRTRLIVWLKGLRYFSRLIKIIWLINIMNGRLRAFFFTWVKKEKCSNIYSSNQINIFRHWIWLLIYLLFPKW